MSMSDAAPDLFLGHRHLQLIGRTVACGRGAEAAPATLAQRLRQRAHRSGPGRRGRIQPGRSCGLAGNSVGKVIENLLHGVGTRCGPAKQIRDPRVCNPRRGGQFPGGCPNPLPAQSLSSVRPRSLSVRSVWASPCSAAGRLSRRPAGHLPDRVPHRRNGPHRPRPRRRPPERHLPPAEGLNGARCHSWSTAGRRGGR